MSNLKSKFHCSFLRSLFAFLALATLVSSFAPSAAATQPQNSPRSASLRFQILAIPDASNPREKAVVDLALAPENADAWNVVLPPDAEGYGPVEGATWIPVAPTLDYVGDAVLRPSQAQEVPGQAKPNFDVLVLDLEDAFNVGGEHMKQVNDTFGNMGAPEIVFEMNPTGAERMLSLSTEYVDRQLGVVLNDRLYSAPYIREPIGKNGSINFGHYLSTEDYERVQSEVELFVAVANGLDVEEYRAAQAAESRRSSLIAFAVFLVPVGAVLVCAIVAIVIFASPRRTLPRAPFQDANAPANGATTPPKSDEN